MGNAFGLGQGFDIVESGKKIREIKPMVDTFRAQSQAIQFKRLLKQMLSALSYLQLSWVA
ncbi:MAG: hypothetical protein ACLSXY_05400 [Veillonella sp.]